MSNSYPYQNMAGYYPQAQRQQMPFPPQPQFPAGFYQQPMQVPTGIPSKGGVNVPGMLPIEESYIENILRLNKGKLVHVHSTFEHNREWNAKIFNGIIEAAGRDHLILSDPQTGKRYLIPMVYVDYVTFDEPIEYEYPFGAGPLASAPPR
ncbi:spore germination protein Q [Lederbergia wuyishanensis]|uniref:Spore germination protein Q n=2 Tax=Lederbergia wuyishanensis TaxID=1347903 RepID=A0ABU0D3I5_9BACI|nr:spore germination protein Q [Lederbergia wuyishanensis]